MCKNEDRCNKIIRIIDLALKFISVIIIGFLGIFLTVKANNISEKQADISMLDMNPYFEISSYCDEDVQTGYMIKNLGGYIQNAQITLKSIINVQVQNYENKDFYFLYQTLPKYYTDLKNNEMLFDFKSWKFGINNWKYEDETVIKRLIEKLAPKRINAVINYMEYMEIQYVDFDRELKIEKYLVGTHEDGAYFLTLVPTDIEEYIKSFDNENLKKPIIEDEFFKEVGSVGVTGVGREFSADYFFVDSMVDVIDAYVEEINNNLIE